MSIAPSIKGIGRGNLGLEHELMPDELPLFGYMKNALMKEAERRSGNAYFNIGRIRAEFTPISLSKSYFKEIAKEIEEVEGMDIPLIERKDRIAFKLIGMDYIGDDDKLYEFFEKHPDKHIEYIKACETVDTAYKKLLGTPYEALNNINEIEDDSIFGKYKKPLTLGIIAIIAGASACTIYNVLNSNQNNVPDNGEEPNNNVPNSNSTDVTPPTNGTDIVPPSNNGTDIIPPNNGTDTTPPDNNQTEPDIPLKGIEGQLYNQSQLFRELYPDKEIVNVILEVAGKNGSEGENNLAYQLLEQIEKSSKVYDKHGQAREVFKVLNNYVDVKKIQKMSQIYNVGNVTLYAGTADALINEIGSIDLGEVLDTLGNSNISLNFDSARKHMSFLRLGKYVIPIRSYPKDWVNGVGQIEKAVYENRLHTTDKGEIYVWTDVIKPLAGLIMKQRANGLITAPDGEINIINDSVFTFDAETGSHREINADTRDICLALGVKNVNLNSSGVIPAIRLHDITRDIYIDRTTTVKWGTEDWIRYNIAIAKAYKRGEGLSINWPECAAVYKVELDRMIAEGNDVPVFLIGVPLILNGDYPKPILPEMSGQICPRATQFISLFWGINSTIVRAPYPNGVQWHADPFFDLDGYTFSFFGVNGNYGPFISAYKGPQNPYLEIRDVGGKYKEVKLQNTPK